MKYADEIRNERLMRLKGGENPFRNELLDNKY